MSLRYLVPSLAFVAGCTASQPVGQAPTPVPAPTSVAGLRALIDTLVEAPEFANAHWGVLIVDPARGDTLYSRNADKLFMPASNVKIVTGAVALAQLGPDYRFRTVFVAGGPIRDGVLHGDLLVVGHGDPTLSDRMQTDAMLPMRAIADSLAARGIGRVAGTVREWGDAFPDANHGYGWGWDDFEYPYSAGVDQLIFNDGFARVTIRGGARPGDTATARTTPDTLTPPLRVLATTIDSSGGKTAITVRWDSTGSGFVVRGSILVGDSTVESVAYRDASAAYLAALMTALRERGIAIGPDTATARKAARQSRTGAVAGMRGTGTRSGTTPPGRSSLSGAAPGTAAGDARLTGADPVHDTLFTIVSAPLREILPVFEKPSQNQIGEILLKTLGRERRGSGTADSGAAVVAEQLAAWGVPREGFALVDGSGLSRHNYLSPRTIIRILDGVRRDSAFTVFYDALPVAGVDGTIASRMRGTPAQGNVRAKTGFIDKARALSGYVTTADGSLLYFSLLCNNYTVPTAVVNRVQDRIAARLASLHLNDRNALGR